MVAVVAATSMSATPAWAATAPAKPYDFDGNGYPDLAIGAPDLRVNAVRRAGGVIVLPSSAKGPSRREKVITQSSRGVPGGSERGDQFGFAVASADFDRDGFADLAVGQPGETVGAAAVAGSVTVIYGSRKGLKTTRSVAITQPGGPREESAWGSSLAALDVNVDGYPDLAVGAPWTTNNSAGLGGTVGVLPGGARGLSSKALTVITGQPESEPDDYSDADKLFGAGLATGDLDGDRDVDLVIMSEGASYEGDAHAGSVTACLAQAGRAPGCRRLLHDELHEGFTSVAVGNMSGDALPEIVIGSVFWDDDGRNDGAVTILRLETAGGLGVAALTELGEDSRGIPGTADTGDGFGERVALSDIDRDGYADLVVGAPGENNERGRVTVIHGARSGWRTSGNYTLSQSTKGIPGSAERGDVFGSSLMLLDYNRDGRVDLTIGAPGENRGSGVVTTLPGSGKRFSTSRSHTFGLSRLGYRHRAGAASGTSPGR